MKTILNALTFGLVTLLMLIGFQGTANAQYSLPTILVIDTYLGGIDSLTFPMVAGQGPDDRSEARRNMKCKYLKSVESTYQCKSVASTSPTSFTSLQIDPLFSTAEFIWQAPLMRLATYAFNTEVRNDQRNAAVTAYTEAIGLCKQDGRCLRQVTQFFGITTVMIPDEVPWGVGGLINDLLNKTPAGNSLESSAAGKLLNKFGNAKVCKEIAYELDKNTCD
jgi:hypothetical protein